MITTLGTPASETDPRWDDRVPWPLRYPGASISGDVDGWLTLVAQRLEQYFLFNEAHYDNMPYFGTRLASETLGNFQYDYSKPLPPAVKSYFSPAAIQQQADHDCYGDAEETAAAELSRQLRLHKIGGLRGSEPPTPESTLRTELRATTTRAQRLKAHREARIAERIATLEALLRTAIRLGCNADFLLTLIADINRFCAAKRVPLNIRVQPLAIVPIEELLLQQNVIDPLLARLETRWPERAKELIVAYHDMLAGKPLDEVFGNAFKSVEEIARALTGDQRFEFSDGDLYRYFPLLHPTIKATIGKLRAHRGDEGAHGRKAPDPYEIRYLLFQLCNTALLLLDYDAMKSARGAI